MTMTTTTLEQIATIIARGDRRPQVRCDPGASLESGAPPEGPWYIAADDRSWCYYRTREEARATIRAAELLARKWVGLAD